MMRTTMAAAAAAAMLVTTLMLFAAGEPALSDGHAHACGVAGVQSCTVPRDEGSGVRP